jgi:hypothetical protein
VIAGQWIAARAALLQPLQAEAELSSGSCSLLLFCGIADDDRVRQMVY